MALDMNALAATIATRISGGDAVTRVQTDEGSTEFESSLDQARALEVLQRVNQAERRRTSPVTPRFFGLQPFSNVGLCGDSTCNCR